VASLITGQLFGHSGPGPEFFGALAGGASVALLDKTRPYSLNVWGINPTGNAVDMFSVTVAGVAVLIRPVRRLINGAKPRDCFDVRSAGIDLLNGAALVPFLFLIGSVFSIELMKEALQTNKVFMGIRRWVRPDICVG
jgi:hypothetical protein